MTFTLIGDGQVTVSDGKQRDCPATCHIPEDAGTRVTLTAHEQPGSTFAGWTAPCDAGAENAPPAQRPSDGAPEASCTLTLNASQSLTATFESSPTAESSQVKSEP